MPLLNLKDGDWYRHFLKSVTVLKKPYRATWHFVIITAVTSLDWSNFLSTQSDACFRQKSSSYTWRVGIHTREGHSKFKILGAKLQVIEKFFNALGSNWISLQDIRVHRKNFQRTRLQLDFSPSHPGS